MKEKYLISVSGTQQIDGERDSEELTTTADFTDRDGKRMIKYREFVTDGAQANIVITNLIKLEQGKVTLIKRMDGRNGQMIFELDKRHQCMYANEMGTLTVGIFTKKLIDSITPDGGTLEIDYTLDFNGGFESENHIYIMLKKTEE